MDGMNTSRQTPTPQHMQPEHNFTASKHKRNVSIADALEAVAALTRGIASAAVFEHGSVQVKMYRPSKQDLQEPHTRDELYFIARGSGWFENGTARHPFGAGDMLFVPAGVQHRFDAFTEDFCTWVVFYGPQGGERMAGHTDGSQA